MTEHFVVDTETESETAKVVVQVVHEADETPETREMKQSVIPGQRVHVFGKMFLCPVGPDRVIVVLADAVRILSLPVDDAEAVQAVVDEGE